MNLVERMKDVCGLETGTFGVRLEVLGFSCVGIFGSCKVIYMQSEEIEVMASKMKIKICGENLIVLRLETDEIYISGEIKSVEKIQN